MKTDLASVDPDTILGHIANGGSLKDLSEMWGCRPSDVHKHLLSIDPDGVLLANAYKIAENMDKDLITEQLRHVVGSKVTDAYSADGELIPVDEWPIPLQASVQGIELDERYDPKTGSLAGTSKKVKFMDKLRAIELLGKERGMFNKSKVEVQVSLEQLVADSWKADPEIIEATHVIKSNTETP